MIRRHLTGADDAGASFTMGVYPMLLDETCHLLAVDFDGETWGDDAVAYLSTCTRRGVPAALERSRSGNGGHVWLFFDTAVAAGVALPADGSWKRTSTGQACDACCAMVCWQQIELSCAGDKMVREIWAEAEQRYRVRHG